MPRSKRDGIFDWLQLNNELKRRTGGPETIRRSLTIDRQGQVTVGPTVRAAGPTAGNRVEVDLYDANQQIIDTVHGFFTPLDHSPGGIVLFPDPPSDVHFVSVNGSPPIAI